MRPNCTFSPSLKARWDVDPGRVSSENVEKCSRFELIVQFVNNGPDFYFFPCATETEAFTVRQSVLVGSH